MTFEEIKSVMSADECLDIAIKRANRAASELRSKGDKFNRFKNKELKRILVVRDNVISRLNSIVKQFPSINDLTEFYRELIDAAFGVYELKKALAGVSRTRLQAKKLYNDYASVMKHAKDESTIRKAKSAYYGRLDSILKTIDFEFLNKARKNMQDFPVIKSRYTQIAITGFPNVGKSTLLSKLSGSTPEIASYAFTTKSIMVGYFDGFQLLDTPGTLNRFNRMNSIEQQAFLVMKHAAEKIIYVFDLTEPYPLAEQEKLFKKIKEIGKEVIVYLSKTDILDKEKYEKFAKKYDASTSVSELKKRIK